MKAGQSRPTPNANAYEHANENAKFNRPEGQGKTNNPPKGQKPKKAK